VIESHTWIDSKFQYIREARGLPVAVYRSIAPGGKLADAVVPAALTPYIFFTYRKIGPTREETLMTKTLTALVAAAALATSTYAVPTPAGARCVGCAVGAGERPADAPPGYVYYSYGEPLPGPNCYWYRMPVYDAYGNMIGWRGRPVAFCSWLAGFRPWPLP
jgi:hypothetical protein